MTCCNNTIDLGCANNCSDIHTGLTIANGTYKIVANYETDIAFYVTITGGELIFPTTYLSESRAVTLKVYDDNNDLVTFTIGVVEYDCLKINITYQVDVTLPD